MISEPFIVDDRDRSVFRVRRATMTDAGILEQERAEIFDKSWLYVGHESELAQAHAWKARDVGGRPIIFVRGQDLDIRVFYNVCSHRGTTLCREAQGVSRVINCFYHAWGFETTGALVTVPSDQAYSEGFDRSELGLKSPARVDSYRGFYFLSYDLDVEPLNDFLPVIWSTATACRSRGLPSPSPASPALRSTCPTDWSRTSATCAAKAGSRPGSRRPRCPLRPQHTPPGRAGWSVA